MDYQRFIDRLDRAPLSKRRLESLRRAEVVAQISRHMLTVVGTPRCTSADIDLWSGAILDWMTVTGQHKYAIPKRRGRHK